MTRPQMLERPLVIELELCSGYGDRSRGNLRVGRVDLALEPGSGRPPGALAAVGRGSTFDEPVLGQDPQVVAAVGRCVTDRARTRGRCRGSRGHQEAQHVEAHGVGEGVECGGIDDLAPVCGLGHETPILKISFRIGRSDETCKRFSDLPWRDRFRDGGLVGVGSPWLGDGMDTTTSADGTVIAFEQIGDGPPVVIVGGAFSTAADGAALAAALLDVGFRAVTVDRRARGASGDKRGSTPEDEADDLAAVIEAVGGDAIVLGHSSGAVLALYAALLTDPPFRFGEGEPDGRLADRLQDLVDAGRAEDAVVTFQLEGVELPREMVESIRQSDMFPRLVPLAQSTVYDARLTAHVSNPTPEMLALAQPVTILRGEQTFPLLVTAANRLAEQMVAAELVIVPESVMHRPDPVATARVVRERVGE
jgi:pimeloyl-ACP methyl ester carboxylesterase